jgi:Leucine-rich repeat (LRR) protein
MDLINSLIIFLLLNSAHSTTLNCKYRQDTSHDYECFVDKLEIQSIDSRNITAVTGFHVQGKSNENVNGIRLIYTNISHFPRNLEKFFKNLEYFHIWKSNLKEISADDLKPFPKLKVLDLFANEIEKVDENLFNFTPHLEVISFAANKIQKLEKGAFDGLKMLRKLDFEKNLCYESDDESDEDDLKKLIEEIEDKCENFVAEKDGEDEKDADGSAMRSNFCWNLLILDFILMTLWKFL